MKQVSKQDLVKGRVVIDRETLDPRYKAVKLLIQKKQLRSFQDIFTYIPMTVIAGDLRTNNNRMGRLTYNPGELTYEEGYLLA